jgi:hypothetical protein
VTTHKCTTLSGERITLASDDTLSLGFLGPHGIIEESTPTQLASTFSRRTLLRVASRYPAHASERSKIGRALADERAETIGLDRAA